MRATGDGVIPVDLEFLEDGGSIGTATGVSTGQQLMDAHRVIYATPERTLASVYQIHDDRRVEPIDLTQLKQS